MKLHDLQVGQRFTFIGKHRGKVFEVIKKNNVRTPKGRETYIIYHDVIHKNQVISHKESKTFRMEVELVTLDKMVSLTSVIGELLQSYQDEPTEAGRSALNKLYLKLTGLPGRRVDKPED